MKQILCAPALFDINAVYIVTEQLSLISPEMPEKFLRAIDTIVTASREVNEFIEGLPNARQRESFRKAFIVDLFQNLLVRGNST